MATPTTSWDETSPSGSQAISLGDDRIREMKTQFREIINVDHYMASSGNGTDWGKHNKVSLLEQADLGTGANGKPILGAQTVSSKAELVFTDEDDIDVILTTGGKIRAESMGGVYAVANVAAVANILNYVYPVGIVLTLGVSTNPNTLFGIGTWSAIAGRVIVGIDAGQTEFDTLDETGGAKTHTLQTSEIPSHSHTKQSWRGGYNAGGDWMWAWNAGNGDTGLQSTDNTGGGGSHNNLQPYIVKYVWQRTA